MAKYEIDHLDDSPFSHHPHHTTPLRSHQSPSISFYSPHTSPFPTSHRTRYNKRVPPTTPFASDHDRSWQAEISWQFEPTGAVGAALSPWTGPTPSPSPGPTPNNRVFRQSAKDYYLSSTSNNDLNFRNFTNPYYEYSNVLSPGRIELQSFVVDHQPHSSSFNAGYIKSPTFGTRKSNYSEKSSDIDHEIKTNKQDPRWFSVSHAYVDGKNSPLNGISFRSHDQDQYPNNKHYYDDDFGRSTRTPQYLQSYVQDGEEFEDEVEQPKTIGIFGLFKYSTKMDMFLVIIGCFGALINGGSLPWYSYLFGDFVNKIALDNDKNQMMEDVRKVCNSLFLNSFRYAFV